MAIAGIALEVETGRLSEVEAALKARPDVTNIERLPNEAAFQGFCFVLEKSSDTLHDALKEVNEISGVTNLNLAYASYEDDWDENGQMKCPKEEA